MKTILLSLCTISILLGTSTDPQSILNEVSNLRQKYEECRASQDIAKGSDSKALAQYAQRNRELSVEINRKNGVIKSLEQTMLLRDRSYRETIARNKSLIAQLHTQNVTGQEREMLKRALISVKGELALAQKELRGGSSSIVRMREELKAAKAALAKTQSQSLKGQATEKVVTKVVESTEKLEAMQLKLNAANSVIKQLQSAPTKMPTQQPTVIYKDRIVTQEKIVYKERPVEKVIEKVIYKDRPVEKVIEKVVYKDRIVTQEKVVYKDRPVEKIMTKTVVEKPVVDENLRRKIDKLALELERAKTLNLKYANDLAKMSAKRKVANESSNPPPIAPIGKHIIAKSIVSQAIKKGPESTEGQSGNTKKSSGVYRMASDAPIYSAPNGKIVDTWEVRRSFTGNNAANGWIHITGYFVNRVFQGVGENENLWVKESDVIRR